MGCWRQVALWRPAEWRVLLGRVVRWAALVLASSARGVGRRYGEVIFQACVKSMGVHGMLHRDMGADVTSSITLQCPSCGWQQSGHGGCFRITVATIVDCLIVMYSAC